MGWSTNTRSERIEFSHIEMYAQVIRISKREANVCNHLCSDACMQLLFHLVRLRSIRWTASPLSPSLSTFRHTRINLLSIVTISLFIDEDQLTASYFKYQDGRRYWRMLAEYIYRDARYKRAANGILDSLSLCRITILIQIMSLGWAQWPLG
jgi:hypothetical protein